SGNSEEEIGEEKARFEKGGGENEGPRQEDNRCEDVGRTQDTGSGKKPERGYGGICTRSTESEGRAIGRFTGIVQHRRCGFSERDRVDRGRKRVRSRRSDGRRTRW